MPDNLALRMRPTNDRSGHRSATSGRTRKNHPSHGGSQSPVLHDSLSDLRGSARPVLLLLSPERPSMPFGPLMQPLTVKNACKKSQRKPNFLVAWSCYLDEIHRLDKTKQDFLLPLLESGLVIMIGATTENPFFSVTPAIRSRVQIFELEPLTTEEVKQALQTALDDPERGFDFPVELDEDALDFIATSTNGDLRSAFNSLDLAVLSTSENAEGIRHITLEIMENSLQRSYITMDKDGDGHYDVLSALQKSIRGSDVDASLHYAARLIEAGDLPSLARRLTVIAYEDIGLANPDAQIHTVTALASS